MVRSASRRPVSLNSAAVALMPQLLAPQAEKRKGARRGTRLLQNLQYTADYDGNQAMVKTKRGFLLPVTIKRIDARTARASLFARLSGRGYEPSNRLA